METNNAELRKIIECLNSRNKKLSEPFAERIVSELAGKNPASYFLLRSSKLNKMEAQRD